MRTEGLAEGSVDVIGEHVSFRFFAIPGHHLAAHPQPIASEELVEPEIPPVQEAVERALAGAEFRDMRAKDRLRSLLLTEEEPKHGSPGEGCGPSAIFARPPQDLPALLRMADQLETLAKRDEGERALVWKCGQCASRYAVPVALARPVSIRCERCGSPVELIAERSIGEETLVDPFRGAVNDARRQLAGFFREAMARGWPVLVCMTDSRHP
jgi:DNA-directed RNA polymerase subunit RPC12/RpoP